MIGIYQDSFKKYLEDNLSEVKQTSKNFYEEVTDGKVVRPALGVNLEKKKIIIIYTFL